MSSSPNQSLILAMDSHSLGEDELVARVRDALAAGADPNMACREFNDFRCMMGLATKRQSIQAVDLLLEAGGSIHWPGEETDISAMELSGEEDVNYAGDPVDPLSIAVDRLAWVLGEYQRLPADKQLVERQQILAWQDMVRHLAARGGDYFREDPATARTPACHLLLAFTDAAPSTPLNPTVRQAMAETMFDIACQMIPDAPRRLLDGDWKAFPQWHWEWYEDYPELVEAMRAHASRVALDATTPAASGNRSMRL